MMIHRVRSDALTAGAARAGLAVACAFGFSLGTARAQTLETAAALVRHGADPDRLQRRLFSAIPLSVLRLQSRAVENLVFGAEGLVSMLVIEDDFGADLGAGAEAGVEHALLTQGLQGIGVVRHVLGLAAYRPVPVDAQPGEVLEDRLLEGRPAARTVDVLDAQQEAAALGAGIGPGDQRRIGVAEVHVARRRRREAHGLPRVHGGKERTGGVGIIVDWAGHLL